MQRRAHQGETNTTTKTQNLLHFHHTWVAGRQQDPAPPSSAQGIAEGWHLRKPHIAVFCRSKRLHPKFISNVTREQPGRGKLAGQQPCESAKARVRCQVLMETHIAIVSVGYCYSLTCADGVATSCICSCTACLSLVPFTAAVANSVEVKGLQGTPICSTNIARGDQICN